MIEYEDLAVYIMYYTIRILELLCLVYYVPYY